MSSRIKQVKMKNFGLISDFACDNFSKINLIIGENGTGKTFLLKALYAAVRSLEEFKRGDDIKSLSEVLAEKLRWTFQVEKLGDIVAKGSKDGLLLQLATDKDNLGFQFSSSAVNKIMNVTAPSESKAGNSIFIPAKEVLSLYNIILQSRDVDKVFGFDDTYYDLAKALRIAPAKGKNYKVFADSRKLVSSVIAGKVEYDNDSLKWYYKNAKNQKIAIGATSEGVKKIAIMDRLLANGYLDSNSIIFIDEIESALHPQAICKFLDMLQDIAEKMNIQIFITSHSYFVIKKLALIAKREAGMVSCIYLDKEKAPYIYDLHDGMQENSIIDTSIALYEQEIEEVL